MANHPNRSTSGYSIKVVKSVDTLGRPHVYYWAYAPGGRLIVSCMTRKDARNAIRCEQRRAAK